MTKEELQEKCEELLNLFEQDESSEEFEKLKTLLKDSRNHLIQDSCLEVVAACLRILKNDYSSDEIDTMSKVADMSEGEYLTRLLASHDLSSYIENEYRKNSQLNFNEIVLNAFKNEIKDKCKLIINFLDKN